MGHPEGSVKRRRRCPLGGQAALLDHIVQRTDSVIQGFTSLVIVVLGLGALPDASVTAQVPREIPPPAVRDSVRRSSLAKLAEGRRRWRRAGITDYLLQAHTAGGLPVPRAMPVPVSVLITVRRGRVVARSAGKPTDREAGPETITCRTPRCATCGFTGMI